MGRKEEEPPPLSFCLGSEVRQGGLADCALSKEGKVGGHNKQDLLGSKPPRGPHNSVMIEF